MLFYKAEQAKQGEEDDIRIESIPINMIRPNPYQPRRYFSQEAIRELACSIKEVGLIQPISVRRVADSYELIAGERRLRAAKMAGLKEIKAVVRSIYDKDSAMMAMVENLQRENLNYFEEAEGYLALIREHGLTQEQLAERMSKNQSTVANKLRILKLPAPIKKRLIQSGLSERHARALLRLHDEPKQSKLLDIIEKEALSVKETEELVEKELTKMYGEEKKEPEIIMRGGWRIYVNTVKKTVKKLEKLGISAIMKTEESGENVNILIVVPKL